MVNHSTPFDIDKLLDVSSIASPLSFTVYVSWYKVDVMHTHNYHWTNSCYVIWFLTYSTYSSSRPALTLWSMVGLIVLRQAYCYYQATSDQEVDWSLMFDGCWVGDWCHLSALWASQQCARRHPCDGLLEQESEEVAHWGMLLQFRRPLLPASCLSCRPLLPGDSIGLEL